MLVVIVVVVVVNIVVFCCRRVRATKSEAHTTTAGGGGGRHRVKRMLPYLHENNNQVKVRILEITFCLTTFHILLESTNDIFFFLSISQLSSSSSNQFYKTNDRYYPQGSSCPQVSSTTGNQLGMMTPERDSSETPTPQPHQVKNDN